MKRFFLLGCLLAVMFTACNKQEQITRTVVPKPNKMVLETGSYLLKEQVKIAYGADELKPAAEYLKQILYPATGYKIELVKASQESADITLSLAKMETKKPGTYLMNVTDKGTTIEGNSYSAIINGIQTLRQLLPVEIESKQLMNEVAWNIPFVSIEDEPLYEWRGMMLDVSRHFYDKAEIKEFLDLMALYKLNKFHWHLTDDQGWRIEIKQYPKLTSIGGWRELNGQDKGCLARAKSEHNSDMKLPKERLRTVDGKTEYGGYYTQEDIKEIVAYAKVLGIDIIPELDMPGHSLAAIANYEGVACFPSHGWGHTFSSPICPGKESALTFCKNVYREVFDLFPYKYVHIGGDEVEKTNWKKCPDCQKRIKACNLKNEHELQAWFIKYMERFFNENGKKLIGWDEILEGGLSETATVSWWRSWVQNAVPRATAQGNDAILCPTSGHYFDYGQDKNTMKTFYMNPSEPKGMSAEQLKHVIGMQANIWCEWIPSRERMQYQTFPRLLVLAEKAWTQSETRNWSDFYLRLQDQYPRLETLKVNYRIPDIEGFMNKNAFVGKETVKVSCPCNIAEIRYTTDGSIPTKESTLYTKPITIDKSTSFIFCAFTPKGRRGDINRADFIKSEFKKGIEVSNSKPGLEVKWYEYAGNSCKDITTGELKGTYVVDKVTIPKGVGMKKGLVLTGYIEVPVDGVYTFDLTSDDGSLLFIDGDLVIDNDGPHSPRSYTGQKVLGKGLHPIKVTYFDHNGGVLKMDVYDKKMVECMNKKVKFVH